MGGLPTDGPQGAAVLRDPRLLGSEKGKGSEMKICACGHRITHPVPVGIQFDAYEMPALILFNCKCGSTNAIRFNEAPAQLRWLAVHREAASRREAEGA